MRHSTTFLIFVAVMVTLGCSRVSYTDARASMAGTASGLVVAGVALEEATRDGLVTPELAAELHSVGEEVLTSLGEGIKAGDDAPDEKSAIKALQIAAGAAIDPLGRLIDLLPDDNPRADYYRLSLVAAQVTLATLLAIN